MSGTPHTAFPHHCDGPLDHGTLLWIGDRRSTAFRPVYEFCDSRVAQIAYRPDLSSAVARPAQAVRTILYCRENDSAVDEALFQSLRQLHPDADVNLLTGPLCAGSRPAPGLLLAAPAIDWHQWESQLPQSLRHCGSGKLSPRRVNSVAVVAANYANATALLEIAGSGQATAIWCRPDQLGTLVNVDELWWDDSATDRQHWPNLFRRLGHHVADHVWITNDLSPASRQSALDAGVNSVIKKPGDFTILLDRVAGTSIQSSRRAA
ncbi:hypothetical protein NHH03_13160 [Stieleria sp. TO1_6]|uniref:hypothetical protein n=1 Tax=Stieleria tagensis TaxID=2956795 RepID=UPI00209B792F|nr:hypothetical protein [Stieleria tagensis]MCO8122690.1 hypothetical protein [Stieleria tagensis]